MLGKLADLGRADQGRPRGVRAEGASGHDEHAGCCALQGFGEDDYILFDCPGQIELYSHVSVFRSFVDFLRRDGWSAAAVYCLDCQFVGDPHQVHCRLAAGARASVPALD